MRDAVIGSTAQTPIGKAYHGALSDISGPSSPRTPSPPPSAGQGSPARRSTTSPWAAPCRKAPPALRGPAGRAPRRTARCRAGRDPRPAVRLRADGDRDRRQADHRRRHDRHRRRRRRIDLAGAERARTLAVRRTRGWDHGRSIYISMLDTAENVAERYRVSREAQDASALTSQQRTAVAQQNGLFAGGKSSRSRAIGSAPPLQVSLGSSPCGVRAALGVAGAHPTAPENARSEATNPCLRRSCWPRRANATGTIPLLAWYSLNMREASREERHERYISGGGALAGGPGQVDVTARIVRDRRRHRGDARAPG